LAVGKGFNKTDVAKLKIDVAVSGKREASKVSRKKVFASAPLPTSSLSQ
jgi:hypothetical protein